MTRDEFNRVVTFIDDYFAGKRECFYQACGEFCDSGKSCRECVRDACLKHIGYLIDKEKREP